MSLAKPAATVIVCRQGANGPELIMVKRSRKSGFFPSAWVFPGGRVDEADNSFPHRGTVGNLDNQAFAVAAVRECFEEAGCWLGQGCPSSTLREELNNRTAQLPLDGSLVADLSRIRQWSWWITPDTEPKRYDTRFFVCCLDPQETMAISQDERETVEVCWISPSDALQQHQKGSMFMAPPTVLTLVELQEYGSIEEIWTAAKTRKIEPIQPIHDKSGPTLHILLPTHPNHPQSTPDLGYSHFVLKEQVWSLV